MDCIAASEAVTVIAMSPAVLVTMLAIRGTGGFLAAGGC